MILLFKYEMRRKCFSYQKNKNWFQPLERYWEVARRKWGSIHQLSACTHWTFIPWTLLTASSLPLCEGTWAIPLLAPWNKWILSLLGWLMVLHWVSLYLGCICIPAGSGALFASDDEEYPCSHTYMVLCSAHRSDAGFMLSAGTMVKFGS